MSYDKEKYHQDHVKMWKGFVDYSIKGIIIISIFLVIMAVFFTN